MIGNAKTKGMSVFLILAFLLFTSPHIFSATDRPSGNLSGFVYAKDGTTPVEGAVVRVTNAATGSDYESTSTDSQGAFSFDSLEKGIYTFGVETESGYFDSKNQIGILANKAAKISVALIPGDRTARAEAQDAAQEEAKKEKKRRKALIGKVAAYDSASKTALVEIIKSYLKKGEEIHVQSDGPDPQTDFFQKAKKIEVEGKAVKKAVVGQMASILMEQAVKEGDLVYIICCECKDSVFLKKTKEEREKRREAQVGKVTAYDPASKMAAVEIMKGYLRKGEEVHVQSEGPDPQTDFFQEAEKIEVEGKAVKKAVVGQMASILMEQDVLVGDFVYVNCCDCIAGIPIWGLAAIIAGTGALIYGLIQLGEEEPPVSPFKK